MALDLPAPIAAYFAAEQRNDSKGLARCFVAGAVVHDEGGTHEGHAAIEQWMAEAKRKYRHVTEPLAVAVAGGKTIVTAKVSGAFPGSPVNLRHIFEIQGDKIASLEIRP